MARFAVLAVLLPLAACGGESPKPEAEKGNATEPATPAAEAPAANTSAAATPLSEWLVGTWSFEDDCGTDFVVTYEADGKLDNSGEIGRWAVDGKSVVETITERQEAGSEDAVAIDPPETRRYAVTQIDADHGWVRYQARTVRILRC